MGMAVLKYVLGVRIGIVAFIDVLRVRVGMAVLKYVLGVRIGIVAFIDVLRVRMGMAAFKYVRLQSWVWLPLYECDFKGG